MGRLNTFLVYSKDTCFRLVDDIHHDRDNYVSYAEAITEVVKILAKDDTEAISIINKMPRELTKFVSGSYSRFRKEVIDNDPPFYLSSDQIHEVFLEEVDGYMGAVKQIILEENRDAKEEPQQLTGTNYTGYFDDPEDRSAALDAAIDDECRRFENDLYIDAIGCDTANDSCATFVTGINKCAFIATEKKILLRQMSLDMYYFFFTQYDIFMRFYLYTWNHDHKMMNHDDILSLYKDTVKEYIDKFISK